MELLEIDEKRTLRREEAAAYLRRLADALDRHNSIEFVREGMRFTIEVADQVELEVELEIEDGGSQLEIELSW
jgi:amphi-Trp domain-containing protein